MKKKEFLINNPEAMLKAMKETQKEISKSPESIKAFLIKAGIYNKSGQLKKVYR